MPASIAGREIPRVYRTVGRSDLHEFLLRAVSAAGGRVLYASEPKRAPVYLGIQTARDERVGVLVYPFRATHNVITNRPSDEHRLQLRYGAEDTWGEDHTIARDLAYVDTTLVLGVHLQANLFVGLDPILYDPLPMGISIEFKDREVQEAQATGWHVFERDNISGRRRQTARARDGLETLVLFAPARLLDYVRFEREAQDFRFDPPLRFATAQQVTAGGNDPVGSLHRLEEQFDMSSQEILDVISSRNRLAVAVRGGVAEHHLERVLRNDPAVASVVSLDADGQPDFEVTLQDGRVIRIECKNCSPKRYANGDIRVEIQKTRATQGDPAGRLYRPDQFDVVAACLYAPEHHWGFAYRATSRLERSSQHKERLAPLHRVTDEWSRSLIGAL
ncbi:hypothetical protein [Nonomuraea sp. NPDC003214]